MFKAIGVRKVNGYYVLVEYRFASAKAAEEKASQLINGRVEIEYGR